MAYVKWENVARDKLDMTHLDLVPALARYVPPTMVFDRQAYSAFAKQWLPSFLEIRLSHPAAKPMCAFWPRFSPRSILAVA